VVKGFGFGFGLGFAFQFRRSLPILAFLAIPFDPR
jgi:hypothetical protein